MFEQEGAKLSFMAVRDAAKNGSLHCLHYLIQKVQAHAIEEWISKQPQTTAREELLRQARCILGINK